MHKPLGYVAKEHAAVIAKYGSTLVVPEKSDIRSVPVYEDLSGTVGLRWRFLIDGLQELFPNPEPLSSSFMYERYVLDRIANLRIMANDVALFAELQEGWQHAMTGRQILLSNLKEALK